LSSPSRQEETTMANKSALAVANSEQRALWRLPKVREVCGLSRTTLYRLISSGRFPRPIPLSTRTVAWDSRAVIAWIDGRIKAASQKAAA
jgi:prophage regulatory protein